MLKHWERANSIYVQKVAWWLAELGLARERIDVGMAFGRVGEPWFRAVNPNATVPVIDDDGFAAARQLPPPACSRKCTYEKECSHAAPETHR
jgi:glutathione S-transferase